MKKTLRQGSRAVGGGAREELGKGVVSQVQLSFIPGEALEQKHCLPLGKGAGLFYLWS